MSPIGIDAAATGPLSRPDVIHEDAARFTALLSSPVAERRVEGVQGLAGLKHAPAEDAVLRLLDDENPSVRLAALGALSRLGGAASIEPLMALLRDDSWEIRRNAWLALRAMTAQTFDADSPAAWQRWWTESTHAQIEQTLLARATRPPEDAGRDSQQTGLGAHEGYIPGAPGRRARARPSLRPPAHPDRRAALRALVHLATPASEPELIQLLREPSSPPLDAAERDFVCQALERIGSTRAVPVLAAQRSEAAAWALGRLGGVEAERALYAFPMTLSTLLALDRLHSTNAGPLLPHLVGQMGLITYRGQPDDVMNDLPQPIQRVGANLIRRSGWAPRFMEAVVQTLEDTMNPPLPHGPRPDMPPAWEPLFQRMQSELKPGFVREDGTTTSQPVAALCYLAEDPAWSARLIPLLRHPAVVVRVYIALTLGRLRACEAVPDIADLIREGYSFSDAVELASGKHFDKSQTVRWRGFLCMALGRVGNEAARRELESLATDTGQPRDVRYGAVVGLGFLGSPLSLAPLGRIAREDEIWMIRQEARRAAQGIEWTVQETPP